MGRSTCHLPGLALVRRWGVGAHVLTLRVPAVLPGQPVLASIDWRPALSKQLTRGEAEQLEEGKAAAAQAIAAAFGVPTSAVEFEPTPSRSSMADATSANHQGSAVRSQATGRESATCSPTSKQGDAR